MIQIEPPFRRATLADTAAMADFVSFASEGLAHYLWSRIAGPQGDPWAVGRERAARETGSFSYRNTFLIEAEGRSVAGLIGYPLADAAQAISPDTPPMFLPLQQLESLAPGTWYVNVLAAYPQERGKGCGAALLGLADRLAMDASRKGLSLIVADTNIRARKLYERCGFGEAGRRRMIKEAWQHPGRDWVLLVKAA